MRCPWPVLVCLICFMGCSTVDYGDTSPNHDDEVFDDPVYGQEAPQFEPNGITFTGIDLPGNYERLAVGNLARPVDAPGCCLDYVLAGPEVDDVRIVFGGGLDDGLTFLAERPDEILLVGPLDDILLLDLDADGRNDLVGLRPEQDQQVVVRLAAVDPGPDGPFLRDTGNDFSTLVVMQGQAMAAGSRDFAAGDIDCDGDIDLAIAAPDSNAVVTLRGRGDGTFMTAESFPVDAPDGFGSVRVLVTQLDGQGGEDLVTANSDGAMSVLLADGCTADFPTTRRVKLQTLTKEPCNTPYNCWRDTESAVVAAGDFCSTPGPDLAYAFEEKVWIVCGDQGDFGQVGEQTHGGSVEGAPVADYLFDLDGPSSASPNGQIDDTLVWQDTLHVLRMPPSAQVLAGSVVFDAHRLVRLPIDPEVVVQGHFEQVGMDDVWVVGEVVLTLYTEAPRILLHPAAVDDPTLRLAWPDLGMARWESP